MPIKWYLLLFLVVNFCMKSGLGLLLGKSKMFLFCFVTYLRSISLVSLTVPGKYQFATWLILYDICISSCWVSTIRWGDLHGQVRAFQLPFSKGFWRYFLVCVAYTRNIYPTPTACTILATSYYV